MMVPDYTIRSYRCDELGVCQSLHTLCSTCPQRMTLRPAPPLAAAAPVRMGFYPGMLATEGPYRRRGRLRRTLHTLWAYVTGPFPW